MCVAVVKAIFSHFNELVCGKLMYFYISEDTIFVKAKQKTPFLLKLSRNVV